MERLSYETLKKQNNQEYVLEHGVEKILQFGEGNFLRGFADYFIDCLNEAEGFNGKIVVVQPIDQGLADVLNEQDGLYQLYLRGSEGGAKKESRRLVSCISRAMNPYKEFDAFLETARNPEMRFIISNTTEAGIVYDESCRFEDRPSASFPAKLTRLLYERYKAFENARGFVILSCELIDDNGIELKKCVMKHAQAWGLEDGFIKWLNDENIFCSTLVDRIVTGYPAAEAKVLNEANGFEDKLLDTAELFGFWVVEGPQSLREELPFDKAGLPVVFTDDQSPYKKRKVRILNGAHTSMVMAAYLSGQDIVRSCMEDQVILDFMKKTVYQEIIPTLTLPEEELLSFADAVIERFNNPFIDHKLLDISLNSVSKWKARVMPSMMEYFEKYGRLPANIVFSFAALIAFYKSGEWNGGTLIGKRESDGSEYKISDDKEVLEFFGNRDRSMSDLDLVKAFAGAKGFFGTDLTAYEGFTDGVVKDLAAIQELGMRKVLEDRYAEQ